MNQDDQAFLNQALQATQDDEVAQNQVLLTYQQAIFETLATFEPGCKPDMQLDLTLLRKRAAKFLEQVQRYQTAVAVVPRQQVVDLLKESRTLFGAVAQLCPACQNVIQSTILARFRVLYSVTP